ncbi:biotin/lipoyl-containing protein, partial [Glycomyces tenuis]
MGQQITFNLPDLGEGLTEGEVAAWLVEPGGEVKLNQPFVEVETAKALVEVPSPYDGTLAEHHASAGDTVDVGAPLATFEVEGAEPEQRGEDKRTPNLVGYGAKESAPKRRRRRRENGEATAAERPPAPPEPVTPPPIPAPVEAPVTPAAPAAPTLAKPPVRKLAKDLGVDLSRVTPTGPHGTVSRADVEAASRAQAAPEARPRRAAAPSGGEERIPIKGVRKLTAQNMVASAFTAPHVTVFLTCDVTGMMEAVAELKGRREFAEVKVSPLLLVAKAVL